MAGTTSCGSIKWSNRQLGIMSTTDSDFRDGTGLSTAPSGINGFTPAQIAAAGGATARYNFYCGSRPSGLGGETTGAGNQAFGVQSMGYDANFDLAPTFEFCDSEPYYINEGLPQVEVTVSKILDGSTPIYSMATKDADLPGIFGRAACKCHISSAIFPCDQDHTGEGKAIDPKEAIPRAIVLFKDAQVNSISYTFGTDNTPFQEDITFLGNDVIWVNPSASADTPDEINDISNCSGILGFEYTDAFISDAASIAFPACCVSGTNGPWMQNSQVRKPQFREDFIWDIDPNYSGSPGPDFDVNNAICDPDITVLPQVIAGIGCDGTNRNEDVCVQSITVSADLNREELNCLGKRGPLTRTITPPITINTSVEVTSEYDAALSAVEDGTFTPGSNPGTGDTDLGGTPICSSIGDNLRQGTIRIAICGGLRLYMGTANKVQSITVGGGSTDGENQTVTYAFQTFNTLLMLHSNGIEDNAATWWANRQSFLCDVV